MKRKFTLCLFALAMLVASCGNNPNNEKKVVGQWTIEDLESEDTTEVKPFEIFMVAVALSGVEYVEFTDDKQFRIYNGEDGMISSTSYSFSEERDSIIVNQNGERRAMEIAEAGDDELRLKSNDGTILVLSKKE